MTKVGTYEDLGDCKHIQFTPDMAKDRYTRPSSAETTLQTMSLTRDQALILSKLGLKVEAQGRVNGAGDYCVGYRDGTPFSGYVLSRDLTNNVLFMSEGSVFIKIANEDRVRNATTYLSADFGAAEEEVMPREQ